MFKVASPWLLARVAFRLAIVPTYFLIYYHVKGNSEPLAARAKWSTAREAACHQAGSQLLQAITADPRTRPTAERHDKERKPLEIAQAGHLCLAKVCLLIS